MSLISSSDLPYSSDFAKSNNSIDIAMSFGDGNIIVDADFQPVFTTDETELHQRSSHCIITELGEIPHRTDWGVGLVRLQNSVSNTLLSQVGNEARTQLSNKKFFPEITSVNKITPDKNNTTDVVNIKISYTSIYGQDKI